MNEPSEAERRLERLLERTLRELPLRRAPATLEPRVLGELRRRAALPWWNHRFARWPRAAQAAFVSISAVLVGLTLLGGAWAIADLGSLHESGVWSTPWARQALAVMAAAGELTESLARLIPPDWVYDGLVLGAVLYAALFGLGAAAYRTLYLKHEITGDVSP